MTLTDEWDPPPPDVYEDDDILLPQGVFDVGDSPAFILISSTTFSMIVSALRITTAIRLLRPKYYTTPCSSPL